MKKLLLSGLFLLFVSSTSVAELPIGNIDGQWAGTMVFPNVHTSYELTIVSKNFNHKLVLEAKTQYADLEVAKAKLSVSDVHSPSEFDAEMYEFVKMPEDTYFFRFDLHGNVFSKDLIKGHVDYTSSWSPALHTDTGTFVLRRVEQK